MKEENRSTFAERMCGNCLKKVFKQAMTPFEEFVHKEASSGLLLMACTVVTMSIFIAGLAFDNEQYLLNAKIGILAASLFAGIAGYISLLFCTSKPK